MRAAQAESHLLAIISTQNEIIEAGLDLEDVMKKVVARARELTSADASVIELVEGDELVSRAASGTAKQHLGIRVKISGSLSGACVRSGEILSCDDAESDPRVDVDVCRRVGAMSLGCVPLRQQGTVIGVLTVYSAQTHSFDGRDIETIERLSHLVAAHMSHASRFSAVEYESHHDVLTGLRNRRSYEERLKVEVAKAKRYHRPLSLCLMDLDGFKAVNDTFGHPAGDDVLVNVAAILDHARGTDEVFRIGGDEFAWLMTETGRSGAERAAARITGEIAGARLGEGRITTCYGIAQPDGGDASALHDAADAALYRAKADRTRSPRST